MELARGVRVKLGGGIHHFLLVVASCFGGQIVNANCGVLGAVVVSTFGR